MNVHPKELTSYRVMSCRTAHVCFDKSTRCTILRFETDRAGDIMVQMDELTLATIASDFLIQRLFGLH